MVIIFSYLIHFELIFVCDMHAIFVCKYPVFLTPPFIEETILSLLHSLGTLVKDHLNIIYDMCMFKLYIYNI